MMTFSKGTAAQGYSYFQQDSYYMQNELSGQWIGKGAQRLNLHGSIGLPEFEKVLKGYNNSGFPLLKNSGDPNRNAYTDCTFATPKSVSLRALHDNRIYDAHNIAIEKTLSIIESKYATTRRGAGGRQTEKTGNLVVAQFQHTENREMEPHLHTHCLIMNMTQSKDGKWRTIENKPILKDQRFLRALYENELRVELHNLGYKTRQSTRKGGEGNLLTEAYELDGVSDTLIEKYSGRTAQINSAIEEILSKNPTLDRGKVHKEQKLKTRQSKKRTGAEELCTAIKEIVRNEPELCAITPQPTTNNRPSTPENIIKRALDDISETKAAFTAPELLRHAMLLSMQESVSYDSLEKEFTRTTIPLRGEMYTTEEMKRASLKVLSLVEEGILNTNLTIPRSETEQYLKKVENSGISFKPGQRNAIEQMATSRDSINVIQGDAGTGKTFAVDHLKALFAPQGTSLRGFAPTGKASTELEKVGIPSTTLDSFFMKEQLSNTPLPTKEVWILDESSMVGSIKMAKFLEKAKEYQAKVILLGDVKQLQSVDAGRIFDDIQEHTSVTKAYMGERIRQKTQHMKEIVAYANEGNSKEAVKSIIHAGCMKEFADHDKRIEQVAQEIVSDRQNKTSSFALAQTNKERQKINKIVRDALKRSGNLQDGSLHGVFSSAGMTRQKRRHCSNYEKGQVLFTSGRAGSLPPGTQAKITGIHHEQNEISVQYWDKKRGQYAVTALKPSHCGSQLNVFNTGKKEFSAKDEVIFLKNDKKLGVTNGTLGIIESIDSDGNVSISVGSKGKQVSFNIQKEYNYLDHGYALTTYKSQGATVDKVICTTDTKSFQTNANEFYVAVTRAKHNISFYTDSIDALIEQTGIKQEKASIFDYSPPKPVKQVQKPQPQLTPKPVHEIKPSPSFGMGM